MINVHHLLYVYTNVFVLYMYGRCLPLSTLFLLLSRLDLSHLADIISGVLVLVHFLGRENDIIRKEKI